MTNHDDDFKALRQAALDGTPPGLSRLLLVHFRRLVAHPGVTGIRDLHYQDYDFPGPVCATQGEAMLLYTAAKLMQPLAALEIGSFPGWTAAHIASAIDGELTCVDPLTEVGDQAEAAEKRFWENVKRAGLIKRVGLARESSPEALTKLVPRGRWDFVFVDGYHHGGQPVRDVEGVLPHLTDNALLVLHDLHVPDVRAALSYLAAQNWEVVVADTANYLAFAWRKRFTFGDEPQTSRAAALRRTRGTGATARPPYWWDEFQAEARAYLLDEAWSERRRFGLEGWPGV